MSWNKHRSKSFGCLNGVKQGGVLSPIIFTVYIDELLLKLRSSGFGCYIDDTFVGALGYADDVTLMSPSIRGLKQMVDICETFAVEYDIKFNEKKTVAILFGNGESPECHLKLNGQPVTWVREVKHLGNIVTSDLTDARDCARKRSIFIGSVNKLLGSYGKIQSNVLCKLFQIYCCSFYGSELWCCNSYGFNRCVIEWNKAMRRILRIPYRSHRWLLAQLGQQKDLREHLHIKLLRYLTYALNHCNPIVKTFSDIALRCALSPMGANIALLRYLYYVSFDRKLHVNEQSICNLYKIHSDSEKYATVGVLGDLINCRDGIHVIDYYNYDDITGIIDELCTN